MNDAQQKRTLPIVVAGALIVLVILVAGTIWMGQSARDDTESAVHSVSTFYLEELAGRREQVVSSNLQSSIDNIRIAIGLMTDEDLSDMAHLQAYQARMKQLYGLDKFAFVDENGLIYTSLGPQTNIEDYGFDPNNLTEPKVFVLNPASDDKRVIIAVPTEGIPFEGHTLLVCFEEIEMERMLEGVSMHSSETAATFCNIYTSDGIPLSNKVLGGMAGETNMFDALEHAEFVDGYSLEALRSDFANGRGGEASFSYDDTLMTVSYAPIAGTNWLLTYLIRESVISDQIGSISQGIIMRSLAQSLLTAAVLLGIFAFIASQMRKNARLAIEKEASDTENRIKHQELEQRIALQEQLLEQEKERAQQDNLITSLAADYLSVYYVDLDQDTGICYQAHPEAENALKEGARFNYHEAFARYADRYVTDAYREEFLQFIEPESIKEGLAEDQVVSYRYMVNRNGLESYEMVRFAGVKRPEGGDDSDIHTVSACLTNVDAETRRSLAQNEALSNALATAEEANKAKTAFLSNMSHEIRTPMNAIIGLDNIALNDPDVPEKTRDYLEKIGASAEHLLGLINDILDMSRIESGRMTLKNEEFSFSKLLESINIMFSGQCADKGIDYQCHINGHIDHYYIGDNMKLRQVLINILGNAVKFTPAGGKVELTAERTAQFDDKSTLRFVIADTGVGMSKEFLPHIFDTFSQEDSSSTNKYGSSGLGLAITKNIVEMMNGNILVESEKNVGSTFTVTVTLRDSNHNDADDDIEINPKDMVVLVVDDDPVACEHAKLVLESTGIAAEIATSGEEAIEMVTLRHARRDPYNLILVDWQMPEMDGVETTRRIREIAGHESAIIILTAYRWDDVLEEALDAGVDSFIAKPLFAANVLEEFATAAKHKNIMAAGQKHKADLKGRKILLAEDVQVNAEIMMMVLEMREMEAELAVNGRIAVEKFESNPEGYYDAILMDMRMPEMDGLEATRTIRAMERADAKTIPIIALTANAFDEDVQRSLQAGLNAHLSKPVQPESLFETLESLIED